MNLCASLIDLFSYLYSCIFVLVLLMLPLHKISLNCPGRSYIEVKCCYVTLVTLCRISFNCCRVKLH